MNLKDYYILVRIYNPATGWYSHKRNETYAKQFWLDQLTYLQTVDQLRLDREKGLRYRSVKYQQDTSCCDIIPCRPNKQPIWRIPNIWQSVFIVACVTTVLGIISRLK